MGYNCRWARANYSSCAVHPEIYPDAEDATERNSFKQRVESFLKKEGYILDSTFERSSLGRSYLEQLPLS